MWYFIILAILTCIIVMSLYIRVKSPFWRIQPVFHIYDIHHWLLPRGLINPDLPEINKYVDKLAITTKKINEWDIETTHRVADFIRRNYLRNKLTNYEPTYTDIFEPLKSFGTSTYLSINKTPMVRITDKGETINDYEILSTITSRPLQIRLKSKPPMVINYIDNLCVAKGCRQKGFAPKAIQTIHYDIRRMSPDIKICLFKREGDMTGIVPFTTCRAYIYNLDMIPKLKVKYPNIKLVKITARMVNLLSELYKSVDQDFDVKIEPDFNLLIHLISIDKIVIYGLISEGVLNTAYIFRTPSTYYCNAAVIECIATINGYSNDKQNETFITGFIQSMCRYRKECKAKYIAFEDMGHTTLITNSFKKLKVKITETYPVGFFLYNYACYSIDSKKCLIIL